MLKMKPLGVMDVLIVFCGAGFTGICVCWVLSNCTLLKINVLSEKAMAPHCSTLAWKIPWMEEPGIVCYSPWGRKESDMTKPLHFTSFSGAILVPPLG